MAGVLESMREEDFVQYYLFPLQIEDIINANEEKQQYLKAALSRVESIVRKYSQNYIWHKDSFSVSPVTAPLLSLCLEQNANGMEFLSSDSLGTDFVYIF
jgi:hypothetical protein